MSFKAYIASKSKIEERLISSACRKLQVDPEVFHEHHQLLERIRKEPPDIVFISESFPLKGLRESIMQIKDLETQGNIFIVFTAANVNLSLESQNSSADAFLPIPFSVVKFNSLFRSVLNLEKTIMMVGYPNEGSAGLRTALESIGFRIFEAFGGDEGMLLVHKVFPDIIFADYDLDDMAGVEFCKKVKQSNLSSHIPVIILSHSSDSEVIEKCFEAGSQDVILPPFNNGENIKKITMLVAPPRRGRMERALVIDDSPMIRNLITKMFKQLGFKVNAAENGRVGLSVAREFKPDIITCDYDMPVMNGWDFCMTAKKDKEIKDIPVIMVTARGAQVDKKKGSVLGVVEYLTKPFKIDALKKSVARAMADVKSDKEKEAMSKYVASDVLRNVSDVIDGVKDRKPEEKTMALLFSDICSFTPKCERLSPVEIVTLLNSYFDIMIKIVQENNGIIDKLIGDAILVRFDTGDNRKDVLDAVSTAAGMLKALHGFNKESVERFDIRIGINFGKVVVGNIGSEAFRLDYTMIGNNVNIGQRLESSAPKSGCLISESTYKLVKDRVRVGEGQYFSLKGISKKILAYPLMKVLKGAAPP